MAALEARITSVISQQKQEIELFKMFWDCDMKDDHETSLKAIKALTNKLSSLKEETKVVLAQSEPQLQLISSKRVKLENLLNESAQTPSIPSVVPASTGDVSLLSTTSPADCSSPMNPIALNTSAPIVDTTTTLPTTND